MRYLTQADLDAGLAKWQAILHLQDWEIVATLVPQTIWDSRSQSADCSAYKQTYRADIRLATFDTLDLVGGPMHADMERTLVHELLHVMFRPAMLWTEAAPEEYERVYYEHSIEQTARAFVDLDRRVRFTVTGSTVASDGVGPAPGTYHYAAGGGIK